jgi:hypothetical protein
VFRFCKSRLPSANRRRVAAIRSGAPLAGAQEHATLPLNASTSQINPPTTN